MRMLAAAFGFLAIAAAPATDQPESNALPFDPAQAAQGQQLSGLEEDVAECMFSIARLQLFTVGNQNRDDVQRRMIAICGQRYQAGLLTFKISRTDTEINDFLVSAAGRALNLAASTGH